MLELATFGAAWAALAVGHNVADHILSQGDHIADNKGAPTVDEVTSGRKKSHYGWWENLQHVALYHLVVATVLLITCWSFDLSATWRGVVAGLAWSATTHSFIDRRWPVRWILRFTGSPGFAELRSGGLNGIYLADQALHHGCLFISAIMIAKL
ncbi:DUF3307 domain-containing protein [Plantactinospora sp. S1510]|uniref:DUF3307 domain-containing protein n=1 Tax=Plantactinospora alkalitolerans TaxID=2789879 RepID=A0ABS0H9M6_9ACTN|nr:DUF3307 domain-containing protein [Plantactinospora alkalitolerans]